MSQPKLTLRPPPHRDFIQGFPGIVGSHTRPAAHVAGTVEVRLGTKGLKAAWLRIELRKLETLPGGESWGELIGKGPIDVWSARKDEAYKSDSEKGWELLQTADFPFQVTIPEGLPPSAKLEKQAGVGYELVTSLCVRTKKGLLKKETTSSIIQNTHPLWLDKHELHSTWPVYATPEDHEAFQDDLRVKVMRNSTCYGPGDSIDVRVVVTSERVSPIKVKSISLSVRETITFKGSAKKAFGSNKAAVQKTETLSSKSKSFGKKVYKGDMHTFDLACQIPRTHTLMSIQTAKHIEVSYTLRVQVETAKKPIIIDHLPITVSNFTKAASETFMNRIGWVPGLSTAADPSHANTYSDEGGIMSSNASIGQPTITRSASFGGSTYSGGRGGYPGYPGGDLRRRDTVMTQGTAVSGPGMAGRGVPGQVFSWGQYGSAQPFGAGEAPRPAFAGPPSIYEGRELAPEENRALFHSTNRPQSAMVLGTAVDPVLMSASSYHGNSGAVTPIAEGSEDGHQPAQFAGRPPYQQQGQLPPPQLDMRRQSQYDGSASPSNFGPGPVARLSVASAGSAEYRNTASPANGRSAFAETPYRGPGTPDLGTTRYVQPVPIHQPLNSHRQDSPALAGASAGPNSAMNSAESEKQRLYERARQQAERNQRRADERRAMHQGAASPSTPSSPVANGSRPYSMLNPASPGTPQSASRDTAAVAGLSAEAEKMRLFERARSEAERYQNSFQQGAEFPATDPAVRAPSQNGYFPAQGGVSGAATAGGSNMTVASASQALQPAAASSTMVSGRAAPYSSYMTAEEEKRQLYERAKAETDAFQRGEVSTATATGPDTSAGPVSGHRQAASVSNGSTDVPGAWPRDAPASAAAGSSMLTPTPAPAVAAASSMSSAIPAAGSSSVMPSALSEKEQLRRYYEARDAVSQHLQQGPAGGSSQVPAATSSSSFINNNAHNDTRYAPEVASAVHHATPHQPADTVATPTRTTPSSEFPNAAPQQPFAQRHTTPNNAVAAVAATTGVQSYLTAEEQQSAEEKERLASHYARKAAKAEAKAAAKATGQSLPTPAPATAAIAGSASGVGGSSAAAPQPQPQPLGGASEKAQLAAYYAARDAMEQNLRSQQQPAALSNSAGVSNHQIPELRATSPINLGSSFSNADSRRATSFSAFATTPNPAPTQQRAAAQDQWKPRYNSLYDDPDLDLDSADNTSMGSNGAPPPLPPKIPIGSTFAPHHQHHHQQQVQVQQQNGHRATQSQHWD